MLGPALVCKTIREEFLQVFCQKSPFFFALDESHTSGNGSLWKISPRVLRSIRKCRLRILATPDIVGAFDPRFVQGSWQLRDEVFALMAEMGQLQEFRLNIQACGNQMWNPLWLWHFTSQSFKESKIHAFNQITFDLKSDAVDMLEPNHLARNPDGDWEWHCAEGHYIQRDSEKTQLVRQFCNILYASCSICDGSEASDG